jgi:hypothetical protein
VTTIYRSLTHRLVSSAYYSLQSPFPDNGFEHSNYNSLTELHVPNITHKVFSSQPDFQLNTLATNSRPFHTNLLVFSSPPDYQMTKLSLSLSLILRPTVSRPVYLGIKHPFGAYDQILITVRQLRVCWEGTGLSFANATGPRQRSHSRVRVPWDSGPYFTVSDLGLPYSSPPTTRRVTAEVFDPHRKHRYRVAVPLLRSCLFLRERVHRAVA